MKDVTDMDAAVVAYVASYWVQVVVTCISQQFPISSAAPLRHSRVVRVQGKLLDK